MSGAIQPYRRPTQLDRRTRRELTARRQDAALESWDEQQDRLMTSIRNEGGAVMTGELNFWLEALGHQQDRLQHESPATAARVGHTLDQLAMNGAIAIRDYMRGPS